MRMRVAIVYNEPCHVDYGPVDEEQAVRGVLEAVDAVHKALLELGFSVTRVPLVPPLHQAEGKLRKLHADLVFNLFEGFFDYPETEAEVAEILSDMGIPYTGCPASALKLGLDKAKMKMALRAAGYKTPDFQLLSPQTLHTFRLGYPCIVKPRCEDASHGVSEKSVVYDFVTLERQVRAINSRYNGGAIVEKFIDGREFNATILGDSEHSVLPVSEIIYTLPAGLPRILTFAAKWEPSNPYFEGTKAVCPAQLNRKQQEYIAEIVTGAFHILGGQGYARVDMRMDDDEQINVIEVNPNPDISPEAGAARQAQAAGMTYTQFIGKIVQLALDRKDNEDYYPLYVSRRQTSPYQDTARRTTIQTV